jgi:hypothetical protein
VVIVDVVAVVVVVVEPAVKIHGGNDVLESGNDGVKVTVRFCETMFVQVSMWSWE